MRIVFLIVLDYRCNNDATAMITNILYCVLSVIQGIALNTGILPFSKGRVLQVPSSTGHGRDCGDVRGVPGAERRRRAEEEDEGSTEVMDRGDTLARNEDDAWRG